jgi:cob(I)alamin adenosyltransferase
LRQVGAFSGAVTLQKHLLLSRTTALGYPHAETQTTRFEKTSMPIYTKTGDDGDTGLVGGTRVGKDHLRVDCYGTVDELNACLGVALADELSSDVSSLLTEIQTKLFALGSELATPPDQPTNNKTSRIDVRDVESLEQAIDRFSQELPPLKHFILPGGRKTAALLHLARTVCRRAERRVVSLKRESPVSSYVCIYLNRLSDLLFVLARVENHVHGVADIPLARR